MHPLLAAAAAGSAPFFASSLRMGTALTPPGAGSGAPMASVADVFRSDFFHANTLTWRAFSMPEIPRQAGNLDLLQEIGIPTTNAEVVREELDLRLIFTSDPFGEGQQVDRDVRDVIDLPPITLKEHFHIRTADLQNLLRIDDAGLQLETMETMLNERMFKALSQMALADEFHLIQLLKGKIFDADYTTPLYDFYTTFGVANQGVQAFDFGAATSGILRNPFYLYCDTIIQMMRAAARTDIKEIRCFCGKNFWQGLIQLPEILVTLMYPDSARLGERRTFRPIDYGGIIFEQYVGSVPNTKGDTIDFVAPNEAIFFPVTWAAADPRFTPGRIFHRVFTPGKNPPASALNKPGLPLYIRTSTEQSSDPKWLRVDMESHRVYFTSRPRALIQGLRTG
ncbi:MAG: major capsid protein [Rhodospirillaceae bacterium]